MQFKYIIKDDLKPEDITERAEDGCYAYGFFLEGARWNEKSHILDDSLPKELYTDLPLIHFLPEPDHEKPEVYIYIYIYIYNNLGDI